jgi:hypothetical protein
VTTIGHELPFAMGWFQDVDLPWVARVALDAMNVDDQILERFKVIEQRPAEYEQPLIALV